MKVTAIIPTLNPSERILTVVAQLCEQGFSQIIVVNDGSDEHCLSIFRELAKNPCCVVLTHPQNEGKGQALKTAFCWYLTQPIGEQLGVITLDDDRQHDIAGVIACAKALEESCDALILGVRDFSAADMPPKSHFENKSTSAVFARCCGLRAISNCRLPILAEVPGSRFEYETNLLLAAKQHNIPILEVPSQTIYVEQNKAPQQIDAPKPLTLALCVVPQPAPVQTRRPFPPVFRRIIGTLAAMIGVFLLAFVTLFFGATTIVSRGPSPAARNLFVSTVMETSAAKFLAKLYFDDETIAAMLAGDTTKAVSAVTDTAAVTVAPKISATNPDGITVEEVRGKTFVGKMMIVDDPARLFVKTCPKFDEYGEGTSLSDMIAESGAAAGINAGGFFDPGGAGRGGMPMGVVISGGKLLCNTETQYPTIVGFDAAHRLIAGNFSAAEALAMGMQEAVSFGPVLVSNGKVQPLSGGLNPRTAIGQRADGAVLLLVVDGRQPHSLGATHGDLANLMVQYGTVNAANLDGGSSSLMIYKGKPLNAYSMLTGPRKLPTAFLVKGREEMSDASSK